MVEGSESQPYEIPYLDSELKGAMIDRYSDKRVTLYKDIGPLLWSTAFPLSSRFEIETPRGTLGDDKALKVFIG